MELFPPYARKRSLRDFIPQKEREREKNFWRDDVFSWPPQSSSFRCGETQTAKRITESREERAQKILLLKVKGRGQQEEQTLLSRGREWRECKRIERQRRVKYYLERRRRRSQVKLFPSEFGHNRSDTKVHLLCLESGNSNREA